MPPSMTVFNCVEPSPRAIRTHAMKNCVSVIVAISGLLERELVGVARERWERLHADALRLKTLLVEELHEDGRAAGTVPTFESVSVAGLVDGVVERVAERAAGAGVRICVRCGGGTILADAPVLAEGLFNLVDNAVAASPIGGCVLLTTQETTDGDQCWIIQDTGAGMQGEQLVAFGRPYRSTREGGSGLGAAIARAAVAQHGGLLRVDSHAGSGTTITVWLPRGTNGLAC